MGHRFGSLEYAAKLLQQNTGISHYECIALIKAVVKNGRVLIRHGDAGDQHYWPEHNGVQLGNSDKVHTGFDVHPVGTPGYTEEMRQINSENWHTSRSEQIFDDHEYQFELESMWSEVASLLNSAGYSIPTSLPKKNERETQERARGGRPAIWDWDGATQEMVRVANTPDGLPDKQADMIRHLSEWFSKNHKDGNQPDEGQIKKHVRKFWPS